MDVVNLQPKEWVIDTERPTAPDALCDYVNTEMSEYGVTIRVTRDFREKLLEEIIIFGFTFEDIANQIINNVVIFIDEWVSQLSEPLNQGALSQNPFSREVQDVIDGTIFSIEISTERTIQAVRTSPESSKRGLDLAPGEFPHHIDKEFVYKKIEDTCRAAILFYFEKLRAQLQEEYRREQRKAFLDEF